MALCLIRPDTTVKTGRNLAYMPNQDAMVLGAAGIVVSQEVQIGWYYTYVVAAIESMAGRLR